MLQVIYELPDERAVPLYVGEQMDVYIKAADEPEGVSLDPDVRAPLPYEFEEKPAGTPAEKAPGGRS